MGNHSETGELLEEAKETAITEEDTLVRDSLIDEFGNAIKLDQSPEEELQRKTKLTNPTKFKDASGRDVAFIKAETIDDGKKLTSRQVKSKKAKRSKKKVS